MSKTRLILFVIVFFLLLALSGALNKAKTEENTFIDGQNLCAEYAQVWKETDQIIRQATVAAMIKGLQGVLEGKPKEVARALFELLLISSIDEIMKENSPTWTKKCEA